MDEEYFIKTQKKFDKWLDTVFKVSPPEDVIAYFFLVYPTNRQTYSVVLFGNSKIYSEFKDWAVAAPFVSKPSFTIGRFVVVEKPFDILRQLIKDHMTTDNFKKSHLAKATKIVIGTHLHQEDI